MLAYQSNHRSSELDGRMGGPSSYCRRFFNAAREPSKSLGQPRVPAVPLPQRDDSQHGSEIMTREEARALADRVLARGKGVDQMRVNIIAIASGNTRFADASITTSGGVTDVSVMITVTIGRRRASALQRAGRASCNAPSIAHASSRACPLTSGACPSLARELRDSHAYIADTANLTGWRSGAGTRGGCAEASLFTAGF